MPNFVHRFDIAMTDVITISRVVWRLGGCSALDGVASIINLHEEEDIDVLLGPVCSTGRHLQPLKKQI